MSKSIDAGVADDGALRYLVTVRYGVFYYRYRRTPVGCVPNNKLSLLSVIVTAAK